MIVTEPRAVSPSIPMLIDFETLTPGTDRTTRRSARRASRPVAPDPAIPLWNDDDLPGMLRAEADALARDSVIRLLDDYRAMLEEIGVVRTIDLAGLRENTEVLIAGRRVSTARAGKETVILSLEDGTGLSDATFASESRDRAGSVVFGTELMLVAGTTTGDASLRATNAWDLRGLLREWATRRGRDAGIG